MQTKASKLYERTGLETPSSRRKKLVFPYLVVHPKFEMSTALYLQPFPGEKITFRVVYSLNLSLLQRRVLYARTFRVLLGNCL